MGTIYRRGDVWYIRWTDGLGREQRRATNAKTEREARQLLDELRGQAQRVRLGLEQAPADSKLSLAELTEWWLTERCPEPSRHIERLRLEKHVLRSPFATAPIHAVTADALELIFEGMEREGASVASINRLRTTLASIFTAAQKPPRRFTGKNPVLETRRRQVPRKTHRTLSPTEIARVLAVTSAVWRGPMATAAWLGLRKGEIFALRKDSYDREKQMLLVSASHQRDTTKGDRIDLLPVPAALRPYLELAVDARKPVSPWLFPDAKGRQRTRESDPHLVLRRACARAGVADEWTASCRRCTQEKKPQQLHVYTSAPSVLRCPVHHCKLWVVATPLAIRFHDLRHSVATNLLRAGVPLAHVQRILRHASVSTTVDLYGHLDAEDLRASVEQSSAQQETTSRIQSGTNPAQGRGGNVESG